MGLSAQNWAASPKQQVTASLATIATQVAGRYCSTYRAAGLIPAQPAIPATGAGEAPTQVTTGLRFTNPTAPAKTCLGRVQISGSNAAVLKVLIVDRLVQQAGMSGILITAQSGPTAAIPRGDTTGADCRLFLENYTATGATTTTATVVYVDSANVTRTATVTIPATWSPGQMLEVPAGTGGTAPGVKSVTSVTLTATTGTAGSFGVTIVRDIMQCNMPPSYSPVIYEIDQCGGPRIYDDCAFGFIVLPTTTSSGALLVELTLGQNSAVV